MFLNENVPLIRATPRHQWKYNFRRSFVIENVERTTINRDEHLLPIHYRSRKKNHCSSACPSLCPLILPGQSASGLEIETWSYNCPLGKSDIPRALKLSRLNRRVRHNAPSPWPFFFPLFFFFFSFSLFPFFPLPPFSSSSFFFFCIARIRGTNEKKLAISRKIWIGTIYRTYTLLLYIPVLRPRACVRCAGSIRKALT